MEDRFRAFLVLLGFLSSFLPRTFGVPWCPRKVDSCVRSDSRRNCSLRVTGQCQCRSKDGLYLSSTNCSRESDYSLIPESDPMVAKYCSLPACVLMGHWCAWTEWHQDVHQTCDIRHTTKTRRRSPCCHPVTKRLLIPCPPPAPSLSTTSRTEIEKTSKLRDDLCPPAVWDIDVVTSKGTGYDRAQQANFPNSLLIACVLVGGLVLLIICVVRRTRTHPDVTTTLPPRPLDSNDESVTVALAIQSCAVVDIPPPDVSRTVWDDLPPSYDEVMERDRRFVP